MHKHFKNAYLTHRPVQFASWLVLLSLCVLLIYGAGGLPPTSWRMLFQVTPLLPHLWLMQKTGLLLPLFLLVSQALTWLILACLLLRAGLTLLYYAWSAK